MLKSIQETKKLFTIEGIKNGNINIKTSEYLLNLSEEKQIEVLMSHLKELKRDFAQCETLSGSGSTNHSNMDKMQLQILIQVTESMLAQV